MKIRIALLLFIAVSCSGISLSQNINFEYDDSGNCILKYKTIVMSKTKSINTGAEDDEIIPVIESTIINDLDIKIYPNPTKGNIRIEIEGQFTKNNTYRIMLFDSSGKLLINNKTNEKITDLNISGYNNGIYILRIKYEGEKEEWKIIKE